MWKLLLIAFLARVSGAPSAPEQLAINCFNPFGAALGTYRCPPSPISSNQNGSPIDTNSQPIPFGVSNTGANFYQNFVLNGVVPLGRSNSDPPQAPKRDDYTYTPGVGAHKLHKGPSAWNAARKACNEEGGHLAIINSDEEARVLTEMFNSLDRVNGATHNDVAYLGFHDLYDAGDWVTIFGVSLANTGYKKWVPGQPNNYGGNQHCGSLDNKEGLNDVGCNGVLPYFCELTNV